LVRGVATPYPYPYPYPFGEGRGGEGRGGLLFFPFREEEG